jgi:hypothetical protein
VWFSVEGSGLRRETCAPIANLPALAIMQGERGRNGCREGGREERERERKVREEREEREREGER